jgi:hypothetical protein
MDISLASYKGINLVYLTCNGETHPAFYEPEGVGWLRTFAGGMFTTCGLTYLGSPCEDEGELLGLHGRISTAPARQFADLSDWDGEKYCIKVKGIIEEGFLFGNKLRLERVISSVLGESVIHIHDKITNFGNRQSPFTILYHMNLGYPLLSENTELIIDPSETIPRDTDAVPGLNELRRFIKPQPDFKEQVFYHKMKENNAGDAEVTIRNQMVKIAVTIKFNIDQLPYITQWKMMECGEYVLGIEPCNIPCKSRNILRKENILPFLQPGESKTIDLEIIVNDLY